LGGLPQPGPGDSGRTGEVIRPYLCYTARRKGPAPRECQRSIFMPIRAKNAHFLESELAFLCIS
jgi:hypothetical protein